MNATHDLERDLTRWMEAVAPTRAPDHLAPAIVARTGAMRPRPRWLARLLEPPMQTQLSLGRALGFGRSARPILAVLLILAVLAGVVYVGSQLLNERSLPPPFGVAGNGLIAVEVDGAIVTMNPDGSNMRQLELPFAAVSAMSFSRDGTRFAAWATPSGSTVSSKRSLIVADADGSSAFEVVTERYGLGPVSTIAWSPDDKRLAFSDVADRLYLVDIEASSAQEVASDTGITRRRDPAWAPDGRLAYRCQTEDDVLHLCVMSADLASERVLETSVGTEWAFQHSAWSHDGSRIAYYVNDAIDHPESSFGWDVATINPETGEERILTVGTPEHMILPTWTPDDRYIVTIGAIVAADGSGVRLIGDVGEDGGGCSWSEPSPDGRWVSCVNDGNIALYPVEGGPPKILETVAGTPGYMSWQRLGK
jgi:Tol biopolymer transport system component